MSMVRPENENWNLVEPTHRMRALVATRMGLMSDVSIRNPCCSAVFWFMIEKGLQPESGKVGMVCVAPVDCQSVKSRGLNSPCIMEAVWPSGVSSPIALSSGVAVGSAVSSDAAEFALILCMQMSVACIPFVLQNVHSIVPLSAWQLGLKCLLDPQTKQRPFAAGGISRRERGVPALGPLCFFGAMACCFLFWWAVNALASADLPKMALEAERLASTSSVFWII